MEIVLDILSHSCSRRSQIVCYKSAIEYPLQSTYILLYFLTHLFSGLALQDLTFVDENPDKLNNLINFNKHKLIYQIISDTLKAQKATDYDTILPMEDVKHFIEGLSLICLSDKEIYEKSLQIEPRNASKADIK
jgi:hypothetical protein